MMYNILNLFLQMDLRKENKVTNPAKTPIDKDSKFLEREGHPQKT